MSYANDMPTVEKVARTQAGLAAELRFSVMRLRRRLARQQHPDNPLGLNAMAVLGALYRTGDLTVGELATEERVQPPSMTRTVNCLEEGGFVAYVFLKAVRGKFAEVHPLMWVVAALFVVYFAIEPISGWLT